MTALMQQLSEPVTIRPIKTEADYEAALTELDQMIGHVDPNTLEGNRYALLTSLVEAYEAASEGARPDQFAAQAYTGTWLVATAIRCADSVDHAAVNEAFGKIADMETPLGAFTFDETGEPTHDPIAQIVQGGVFVPLASVAEASS